MAAKPKTTFQFLSLGFLIILEIFASSTEKQVPDLIPMESTKLLASENCKPFNESTLVLKNCPFKGLFGIAGQCRTYLKCDSNGTTPIPICCTEGRHFDHILRKCIGFEDANCRNICPEVGLRIADPNTRHGFLECNEAKVPIPVKCSDEENEYYVVENKTCEPIPPGVNVTENFHMEAQGRYTSFWGGGTKRFSTIKKCRAIKDYDRIYMPLCDSTTKAYPSVASECSIYKKCYKKGKAPRFGCCAIDLHFDHVIRKCIEKRFAQCKDTCKKLYAKYANPTNPRGYLRCNNHGIPEDFECNEGQVFDNNKKECVPAAAVAEGRVIGAPPIEDNALHDEGPETEDDT